MLPINFLIMEITLGNILFILCFIISIIGLIKKWIKDYITNKGIITVGSIIYALISIALFLGENLHKVLFKI